MEALNSKPLGLSSLASSAGPATRSRQQQQRCCQAAEQEARGGKAFAPRGPLCPYDLCLYVRWVSHDGRTKVNRLRLTPIRGVDDLRGLFRDLVTGAFGAGQLPDYLTCSDYYKLTPADEFVSLPGDIAVTQFRLVATLEGGWEHTLVERELGRAPDPARDLLVTVAEFESEPAAVGGGRHVVLSLIAYPTVCVRREFLDEAVAALAGAAR